MENETAEIPNPLLTCRFSDKELDFAGYIVIDSAINGRCCGGIRFSPEVSLNETIFLAKNMTLKYAFIGIPLGGAKVGVCIRSPLGETKRKLVLARLGKILSPFIMNGSYIAGPDMGTFDEDIDLLLNAATYEEKNRYHAPTDLYTSWTMLSCAAEALNELNLKLNGSTVAVEGFGKIGGSAAKVFSENGAKVLAISTYKGAIYNSKGLDVQELLKIKAKYGDDVVNHYNDAEKISKDDLLCSPVDILLPCAGPWTINSTNAHKIEARIICPGANIPTTREAETVLLNRRIISLPDFVSNSGGVFGSFMGSMVTEKEKKEIIEKHFGEKVSHVLRTSKQESVPPIEIAEKIAMKRFRKIKTTSEKPNIKNRVIYMAKSMIPKVYGKIFIKPRAKKNFIRMLLSLE